MASYKNQFEKGLQLGVHPLIQQADSSSEMRNVRMLSKENTNMVAQSMPSTDVLQSLPVGSIVRASKEYNGVTYLILQYENGKTELGSYPSPNYAKLVTSYNGISYQPDDLIPRYAPFQNLKLLGQNFYSSFSTNYLPISFDDVVSMEVQPEYDGTVNMIFTDFNAPIRMINSRFSVLQDAKFEIVDRQGNSDTNLYSEDTLSTTSQMILQSYSIVKVNLDSVSSGGSLKAGNYRYYFAYETADGNATNIIAESSLVSVFFGDTIGSTRGGKENEPTDKSVKLVLTGLDTAYSKLRVYFDYSAGDAANQTTLFLIDATYSITSDTISFTHTGSETNVQTDVSQVQSNFASIDTVKSLAIIGGYLTGANVKEKITNYDQMQAFAKHGILSSSYVEMIVPELKANSDDAFSHLYNTKITNEKIPGDFYNGGYANPLNIYNRLGYMEGEAYVFGIVYILSDGSLSPVFPLTGIDNNLNGYKQKFGGYVVRDANGNFDTATVPTYGQTQIDNLVNGFDPTSGLNTKGIYRFPRRVNPYPNNMIGIAGISIYHLLAYVPEQKPENTIGAFFVRAPRNADRIAQGYAVPTMKLRQSETTFYTHTNFTLAQLNDESYYKVLPIVGGLYETIRTDAGPYHRAIKIRRVMPNGGTIMDPKRYAMIIPDSFGYSQYLSESLNNRGIMVEFAGRVNAAKAAPKDLNNALSGWYATQKVASILQTVYIETINGKTYNPVSGTKNPIRTNGRSYYTVKGNALYNAGLFSSSAEGFLDFRVPGSIGNSITKDDYFMKLSASFNDYFGLVLDDTSSIIYYFSKELWPESGNVDQDTGLDAKNWQLDTIPIAYLVNLYGSGGQRTTQGLYDIYQNTDGLVFSPISQRMSWSEIEAQLDSNRNIKLYGGDSFTTPSFRRVYNTNLDPASKPTLEPDKPYFMDDKSNAKAGQVVMLVTQNANNPYLRGTTSELLNEAKQVWLPYLDGSQNDIRNWRQANMMALEPDLYNRGYSVKSNSVPQIPFDSDAPYIANHWFNRVVYFGPHVLNTFSNSFRKWTGTSYKDYDTKHGGITAVMAVNNMLACVWERALGFIPFRERTYGGRSSTGQVFVEASEVLGPMATILSDRYGSRHMASLIASDNALYGVDAQNRKIWIMTPQGVNLFSDFSIHPYLEKYATSYGTQKIRPGYENIVSGFNKFFFEIWFTFHSNQNTDQNFTVIFSEKYLAEQQIRCMGFVDMIPYHYMSLSEKMVSLNAKQNKNTMWLHDVYEKGFLKLYGVDQKLRIGFIVNPQSDVDKTYENLRISSNKVYPEKIIYSVDGSNVEQLIEQFTKSNLISANAYYENGRVYIPIPDTENITNDPIKAILRKQLGNFDSDIDSEANLQGRALEIILQYSGNKPVEILSTETIVNLAI